MALSAKEIVHRLGPAALTRALDDLLDQHQLVRLANACGLEYPGMRTQTQKRERLLADLVDRAGKREKVRMAILRTLTKETADAAREWAGLDAAEKARRLCDESFLRADGRVGLHLFLLAGSKDESELDGCGVQLAQGRLLGIAENGGNPDGDRKAVREQARLRRQIDQREKKIRHLESQLTRSRDSHKAAKSDLIQRKGELAESRMLVERLRRDVARAQSAAQVASSSPSDPQRSDKAVVELTKSVRKLAAEQKKLLHRVDKLVAMPAPATKNKAGAVAEALAGFGKELTAQAKERKAEMAENAQRIEALRTELRSRSAKPVAAKKTKRPRGQARRVGVFIDVQNVYYAARQLKGKLDFDALLQAAVHDRRLIRATAYVVESKETDQSQFIARLEQRAIEVQRKTLRVRADGSMKGDWDMELALDILDAAPNLDVVVLVSGDGDFTSLVKRVKRMGPRVEVIAFPRNTAKSLVEAADGFQPLDRKFMIYTRSKRAKENSPKPVTESPARRRPATSKTPSSDAGSAGPASGEQPSGG